MWESFLVIIVVVEAVWILSSIFRGAEEERKGPRPQQNPRVQNQPPVRQRSTPTTVDRFLEEINRRRREAAERQAAVSPQPVPAIERPRPAPRPETRRRVPRLVRLVPGSQPVVEAILESSRPARAEESNPISMSLAAPAVPSEALTPAGSAVNVTMLGPRAPVPRTSLNSAILVPMLRDPQSLRTAFVLQEILAPPLARRKRV
jgi:hypothetical protein